MQEVEHALRCAVQGIQGLVKAKRAHIVLALVGRHHGFVIHAEQENENELAVAHMLFFFFAPTRSLCDLSARDLPFIGRT